MPRWGKLPAEMIVEICDRARAGEALDSIAFDLEMSKVTVATYAAHLPRSSKKREERRRKIEICLFAGCDVREAAEKAGASIGEVVRFRAAYFDEKDAREVLARQRDVEGAHP